MGTQEPSGGIWSPDSMRYDILNHCCTEIHEHDGTAMIAKTTSTPSDITGATDMTLRRPQNLEKATFAEKRDIINKLGIKVNPSENLKTMKIRCSLNFSASELPRSDRFTQLSLLHFARL